MKYTLVTGASSSLGKCISETFAKNKHNLILGYLTNEEEATKCCEYLKNKYKINCITYKIDITKENEVKKLYDLYNVEIVINNAALCCDNYIVDKTYEEFMNVLSVNLGGVFLMCKYAKDASIIINISSRDGIDTYSPISLDYSASKSAINNLTQNLALALKNKRIYSVCPGWINTDSVLNMNQSYLSEELKRIGQKELLDKEFVSCEIYKLVNSNLKSGSVVIIDEKK